MSDHRQPTPRDPYAMCPFRETFLLHLTEPAHEGALRTLGNLLFQFAHEWPFPPHAEPVIAVELRAVASDLRHLTVFLSETVPANVGAGDDPKWERALATRAEEWGVQVAALAAEIDQAIGETQELSSPPRPEKRGFSAHGSASER